MAQANYLIVALSLHIIWLLFLSKPSSALAPETARSFPAILIFGDSTVDTGNNNFIPTIFKANYSPYGKDFPNHVATGRFSDGKLIPDMVASKLGIKELVPPFLDPKQLGCRTIVVAGLPPIGCLPIQETISFPIPLNRKCLEDQNTDAKAYNQKLSKLLENLQPQLSGSTILYADIYTPLMDMINNPQKYGFEQTNRGCCGTGLAEAGPLCNAISPTCEDPSKFMFWDSIHPTEATYKFITESLLKQFSDHLNRK